METKGEDCHLISDRITARFCSEHKSWKRYLNFYVTSIAEMENPVSKINFKNRQEA